MSAVIDKVIITNQPGMIAKYGAKGAATIGAALKRLVAADRKRHLATSIVDIGSDAQMKAFGAATMAGAKDERAAKTAVDAIAAKLTPDYILLLDGPDVVPHIVLDGIPGLTDDDRTIESDLPYASDAKYSKNASAYLAVTRVVGRLPMTRGDNDAKAFAALIDRSAKHSSRLSADKVTYFAMSAEVWKQSTQLSLSAVFGNREALQTCPTAGHPAIDKSLGAPFHFINCHGGSGDPRFYGQRGDTYPVAMESRLVAPRVGPGTFVVAECCYGAYLYDASLLGFDPPICMSYLANGAVAFVGSTTIAYGPSDSNGQADLLTQYFFDELLKGASTGAAMLSARQNFVTRQLMSSPTNLKTLAQFVLYGDPSLYAVTPPTTLSSADLPALFHDATEKDRIVSRKLRRANLTSNGFSAAASATYPGKSVEGPSDVMKRFETIARKREFEKSPVVLSVNGGSRIRQVGKARGQKRSVAVVTEKQVEASAKSPDSVTLFRVLTAHILDDGIVAVEECVSR